MPRYQILWRSTAKKELRALGSMAIPKILKAVEALTENPFPSGVKKIQGSEFSYRIRVGDYRVIYNVIELQLIIEIVKVGHRKDVYR